VGRRTVSTLLCQCQPGSETSRLQRVRRQGGDVHRDMRPDASGSALTESFPIPRRELVTRYQNATKEGRIHSKRCEKRVWGEVEGGRYGSLGLDTVLVSAPDPCAPLRFQSPEASLRGDFAPSAWIWRVKAAS
jgi:hypothetical protein